MTITYVGDGGWGTGKGAPLTVEEMDGNIFDLDSRVADLEAYPPEPIEISNITGSGTQMTVHLSNGDSYTLALPVGRGFLVATPAKTVSYELVAADHMSIIQMDSASPLDVTLPANADTAIGVGACVKVVRLGAGTVTIVPDGAATILHPDLATDGSLAMPAQYQSVTLTKLATDTWLAELSA